jgi:phage protein D
VAKNDPVFYVKVLEDGKTGKRVDLTGRVLSFSYKDTDKGPDILTLQIDNFDQTQTDNPIWDPYKLLEITFGYPDLLSPPRQVVIQKRKGLHVIEIEANDKGMLMHKHKKSWVYENVKRSDVVKQIAKEYGYVSTEFIQDTEEVFPQIVRANKTDAEFLQSLANYEGYTFFVDFDGLHFHEEDYFQPIIRTYTYYIDGNGANEIINIDVENDVSAQPGVVITRGRDPKKKRPLFGLCSDETVPNRPILGPLKPESSPELKHLTKLAKEVEEQAKKIPSLAGDEKVKQAQALTKRLVDLDTGKETIQNRPPPIESRPTPQATEQSVKREAAKRFRRATDSTVMVNMLVIGNPKLVAKSTINIEGIGKKYSGKYYVKEAEHVLDVSNGYVTRLKCKKGGYSGGTTKRSAAKPAEIKGTIQSSIHGTLTPCPKQAHRLIDAEGDGSERINEIQFCDTQGRQIKVNRK